MTATLSVAERFVRACGDHADAVLVHHRGKDHTYREVLASVMSLAGGLEEMGVRPGDRVGLLLDNSASYVVSYFAIQLAGGIVVALNPATTTREATKTLVHAQPKVVIASAVAQATVESVASDLEQLTGQILDGEVSENDEGWVSLEDMLGGPAKSPSVDLRSGDVAQIIYTSGTTGTPKGVTLTHANLVANTSSIVEYLRLQQSDSVFAILPFYYSYGNSLLLSHASIGARLVLASDFVFWNRAVELLQSSDATGFSGVPSSFAMLLHRSKFASMEFPNLRYLTCAGGALAQPVVQRLRSCLPNSELFLMYGQTEATARLSSLMPEDLERKLGSIGKGIPGVSLRVLNESLEPTAPGEIGEIYGSGLNIMKGYWRDEEATKRALTEAGLRTGDMARVDEDGFIFIEGRRSDMIKSGAYRINPLEIEEVILELDGIEEVAVVGETHEFLGQAIVAYVVLADQQLSESDIMKHCKQQLPAHKRLKRLELVQELPKTSSGKVKRAELRG